MMTLDTLTYYSCLLKNDLHTIHLHATGPEFDKIHAVTQELYEEAEEEFDELAEMAIAEGCKIGNINEIRKYVSEEEWPTLEDDAFGTSYTEILEEIGHRYIDAIKDVECDDIHKPYIDEIGLFWSKEIDFKNAARKFETSTADGLYTDAEEELGENPDVPDFVDNSLEYIKSDDFISGGERIDPNASIPYAKAEDYGESDDNETEDEEIDDEEEEDDNSEPEEEA